MTHDELHRDFGRMEGRLDAVEDRLGKMEAVLERIDSRLAKIESQETERKGAWKTLTITASLVSGVIAWLISTFGGHA